MPALSSLQCLNGWPALRIDSNTALEERDTGWAVSGGDPHPAVARKRLDSGTSRSPTTKWRPRVWRTAAM